LDIIGSITTRHVAHELNVMHQQSTAICTTITHCSYCNLTIYITASIHTPSCSHEQQFQSDTK